MRVGIDARLVYYHQAGIGQYILNLTEALVRNDGQDEFVLFQSRKDPTRLVQGPKIKQHRLWTPSHHRFESWALSAELFRHSLDVLHSPDFIPPGFVREPSVITVHDLAFLLYPRFLTHDSARYYGQLEVAARRANHIIAVSQSTKRDTVRLLGVPEQNVTVIYEAASRLFRPLDKEQARAEVAAKYGLEGNLVLFVSTIEPRKNLPTLLEAFRKLLDAYKAQATLVIAGGHGWLSEEVYTLTDQLKLRKQIRFLGGVSSEELLQLYNAAAVLALPSFYEGFGLPPLEAMACGTPVIVSNTSSLPEVVGDAGLLVAPQDPHAWAISLWRVLSEPGLAQELRTKGLKRAQIFSWERAARETLDVYRRVARH